jgi:predicted transcriptional regulator
MNTENNHKDVLLNALQESDNELARVTEDLISVLVKKNVILFTDLPEAVQAKLLGREKLRERLGQVNVSILSDDETI